MAKTQQQYFDEMIGQRKKQTEQMYAGRTEADTLQKEQINAAIDQATKTATAQYEQRLEALPGESRALYDKNALNEAVGRMKVRETLANMGLTDSGLSSSMATALTVQKGRADHEVSVNEQKQRQALMDTINQIVAQGETQKADKAMAIDNATRQWYDDLKARVEESTWADATAAYEADQKYAAQVESARIKAAQDAAKYQADYDKQRRQYVQKQLTDNPTMDPNMAWANAYAVYPGEDDTANNYYALRRSGYTDEEINAYMGAGGGEAGESALESLVVSQVSGVLSGIKMDLTLGNGGLSLSNNRPEKDGQKVATSVTEQLNSKPAFAALSKTAQEYAQAAAIGQMVATSYSNYLQADDRNDTRLRTACAQLGVDYGVALEYYNKYYPDHQKNNVNVYANSTTNPVYKPHATSADLPQVSAPTSAIPIR